MIEKDLVWKIKFIIIVIQKQNKNGFRLISMIEIPKWMNIIIAISISIYIYIWVKKLKYEYEYE
jgi:LytS/YehU family sensor histidine kinase